MGPGMMKPAPKQAPSQNQEIDVQKMISDVQAKLPKIAEAASQSGLPKKDIQLIQSIASQFDQFSQSMGEPMGEEQSDEEPSMGIVPMEAGVSKAKPMMA